MLTPTLISLPLVLALGLRRTDWSLWFFFGLFLWLCWMLGSVLVAASLFVDATAATATANAVADPVFAWVVLHPTPHLLSTP